MILPPPTRGRLRLLVLVGGLAVFFWLRLEDHGVVTVVLMGLVLAGLACAAWVWPRIAGRSLTLRGLTLRLMLLGAAMGLLASAFAALLMLLKDGFHGHVYPDYPIDLIAGVLARAPVWAAAGVFGGLGTALVVIAQSKPTAVGE